MKVEVIHQRLGVNPLYKEINNVLSATRFKKLRVLVAYVSWQGMGLIHEQLEAFYDRGNKISMIFGIGGNEMLGIKNQPKKYYMKKTCGECKFRVFTLKCECHTIARWYCDEGDELFVVREKDGACPKFRIKR